MFYEIARNCLSSSPNVTTFVTELLGTEDPKAKSTSGTLYHARFATEE